ncbi:MAG: hypothetical protein Q9P44_14500 [Anaerolineae bacterium]|nr:hypothetical protein [Anaerolineae bacterium]
MAVPVFARHNLDAYIPDTEIIVKIPRGTEGQITREMRNNVVLVQFNVPNLGVLRVDVNDLEVLDEFDLLIEQMEAMQRSQVTDKVKSYKASGYFGLMDKIFIRTMRVLSDDTNRDKVAKIISAYHKAVRWVDSYKEKKADKK